ncbi:MAG: flagellin [Actinomycetes bacterium]
MRITQQAMTHMTLRRLQDRLDQLTRAQADLGTGKRIHRPSDDPSAMNRAMSIRSRQAATDQAVRNAGDGLLWTSLADSKLQTLLDRLHRARELAIRSGSVTNATERAAFVAELEAIRQESIAIANSKIGDRALFAGTADGDAVALADPTDPASAVVYLGNDGEVIRRVGPKDEVKVNVSGDRVFFGTDPGDVDLFSALQGLADEISADNDAGVQTMLDAIDGAMDRILTALAELGAATNRIEAAQRRASDEKLSLQDDLAQVESIDVAEAIMQLQLQQVAYEATLGALARSIQPSLIDFLR